jgi:hypothetical protein
MWFSRAKLLLTYQQFPIVCRLIGKKMLKCICEHIEIAKFSGVIPRTSRPITRGGMGNGHGPWIIVFPVPFYGPVRPCSLSTDYFTRRLSASMTNKSEILKITPCYWNSKPLVWILCDVTGSRKPKMAAAINRKHFISVFRQYCSAIPTVIPTFSGFRNSMELMRIIPDLTQNISIAVWISFIFLSISRGTFSCAVRQHWCRIVTALSNGSLLLASIV